MSARTDKRDTVTIWLAGMAADLRDEDRFAHAEAWDPQKDRGLGRCAYCPGDQPWPCEWQQKVDRLSKQVAYIRDSIVPGTLDAAWAAVLAALPDGWTLDSLQFRRSPEREWWEAFAAEADYQGAEDLHMASGPTPAAALRALAEKLAEVKG